MADKKRIFSKGELISLKRLARLAVKVPGVANAKIGKVLKAIYEENGFGLLNKAKVFLGTRGRFLMSRKML